MPPKSFERSQSDVSGTCAGMRCRSDLCFGILPSGKPVVFVA